MSAVLYKVSAVLYKVSVVLYKVSVVLYKVSAANITSSVVIIILFNELLGIPTYYFHYSSILLKGTVEMFVSKLWK